MYDIIINPLKIVKVETKSFFSLPISCLILGSSESGETTLLYNIIAKHWTNYKN